MRRIRYGMVLMTLSTLSACDVDEPCDQGERFESGTCIPEGTAAGGSGGRGNGGGDDVAAPPEDGGQMNARQDAGGAGTGADCDEDLEASLGADCKSDGDCNCAAPYCAKMPGQAGGLCTVYCEPDPGDCPDGYRCFDLSALGAQGYEPFCIAE